MKKTKLKITSLILAGVLSVGLVSYNGYFNNNIKVEASETDEDTSWTVIDYNKLTNADLSTEDVNLMHENNWLNQEVASQCSKSVNNLTLKDFLKVKYLILSNDSNITNIPNSIKFLSNLIKLNINNNNLTSLPKSIGNLTKLTEFSVIKNKLVSLPESIGNLTNLTCLYLSNNQLTSLPESIGNLTNLTDLQVGNNQLTSLPKSIGNMTNLLGLHFADNKLTELPETIGNLSNVTYLGLYNNKLVDLPDTIGNLSNLTKIELYSNKLLELPNTIGNLSNLTSLDLSNNRLTELPEIIGNLSNLTCLSLNNNNLTELPDTIGNLSNLTELFLYMNNLIELPDTIGNLSKMKSLNISYNYNLSMIPESIGNLSNLVSLNLGGNNLVTLPNTIGNLFNLKILYLNQNNLIALPKTLSNLTNLTYLNLYSNLLEYIPDNLKATITNTYNLVENSEKVSQLCYTKSIPIGLTCSSLNELNNIINNIDYFKNNIETYNEYSSGVLNKNISLNAIPVDSSFFDSNGNAIKTGNTYFYIKLNHVSDSNPYGYIRKTFNKKDSITINSDDYVKIPVHIVQRNTSVSLRVDETLPIEDILKESLKTLEVSNITEEAENTTIQALDENIISNKGKALSIGTTQAVLVTPNYGLITANVNVTDNSTSEKYLNVKFTQPNTMSLTIDTDEIDFGEVNGLTDSTEKTVIASVNSSLPYDLSIKSLDENLTSESGKTIPISKLNVKGEGAYTNIETTDNIIYTNQPNTNGEEVTHPINLKLSEMAGYTKGEYSTNLRVTATQK